MLIDNYYKIAAGDSSYVSPAKYAQYYKDHGWLGRKVMALPKALWCSTILTLCHLIHFLLTDNQVYRACIAKDLNEARGWLKVITSDQSGLYLVQQAQFYRARYFEKFPPVPLKPLKNQVEGS